MPSDNRADDGGSVAEEAATKRLPWCDNCEAFAVPDENGACVCGTAVRYREGLP
jgi:hypothetical protein